MELKILKGRMFHPEPGETYTIKFFPHKKPIRKGVLEYRLREMLVTALQERATAPRKVDRAFSFQLPLGYVRTILVNVLHNRVQDCDRGRQCYD